MEENRKEGNDMKTDLELFGLLQSCAPDKCWASDYPCPYREKKPACKQNLVEDAAGMMLKLILENRGLREKISDLKKQNKILKEKADFARKETT